MNIGRRVVVVCPQCRFETTKVIDESDFYNEAVKGVTEKYKKVVEAAEKVSKKLDLKYSTYCQLVEAVSHMEMRIYELKEWL